MSTAVKSKPAPVVATPIAPHQALVELGIELVAIFVLVMLAGASPRGAKIATSTLASLWIVALVLHYTGSL